MEHVLCSLMLIASAIYLLIGACFAQVTCGGWKCLTFSGLNSGTVDLNGEWQSDPTECVNTVYKYTSTAHPGIHLCHYSGTQNWIFTDTLCDNSVGRMLARCWRARHNIQYCSGGDWRIQDGIGGESAISGVNVVRGENDCGVTNNPTHKPSRDPSHDPTTHHPSHDPSRDPSHDPSRDPSHDPTTHHPSHDPSRDPTENPSNHPSVLPTNYPTLPFSEGQVREETTTQASDEDDEKKEDGEYTAPQDSFDMTSIQTLIIVLGVVLGCLFLLCCVILALYMLRQKKENMEQVTDDPNVESDQDTVAAGAGSLEGNAGSAAVSGSGNPIAMIYNNPPQAFGMGNNQQPNVQVFAPEVENDNDENGSESSKSGICNQITMGAPASFSGEPTNIVLIGEGNPIQQVHNQNVVMYNQPPIANAQVIGSEVENGGNYKVEAQGNAAANVEKCTDCGVAKAGKIFPDTGLFYCNECWLSYE